ncbi:MAG: alpha/beta fold hydrolase, partial [Anaerolineae bacterium]|nr:alpha/beta fold hydrolase [Anaerolineae bacterium]
MLLHGFTGTPHGMRQLGEYLAGQGYTVHGPRLFGHATQEGDLVRARFHDWMASAEDGYYLLRPNTEHLFVLGLSMGGALALLLAAR